ncbi:hypothetical protein [Sphingorhabdus sp. Alg239-R122]|uniref:hypothetical protein n=1 Tax=Sphingorhabdus sp. Alg239-R122 TaxID=2305989 RepID=UPI0013DBC846|nr:hypothetical protein [Sphingorhabdus sp. Alg239-R122]
MRKTLSLNPVIAAGLSLSLIACSSQVPDEEGVLTETELGDVDVLEGTISDDMIQPDALSEAATEEAEALAEAAAEEQAEAETESTEGESADAEEQAGSE